MNPYPKFEPPFEQGEPTSPKPNFLKYKTALNTRIEIPPCKRIVRVFPTGYLSFIVAPPSAGKSFLTLKLCCDLSLGGGILEGKANGAGFTTNLAYEDEPVKSLILAGESGASKLVERLRFTGWKYDDRNFMKVFDARRARLEGVNLLLNTLDGQKGFRQLIDDDTPQIIFVDSLMSFNGADESKGAEMRDVLSFLEAEAFRRNVAIVINHHTRKTLNAKMRGMPQNMDEAIGSSMISRYCALMMGLQPQASDGDEENNTVLVRCLKSWDRKFKPFSFTFGDNSMSFDYSHYTAQTSDVAAAGVLAIIGELFLPNEEFTRAQLEGLEELNGISAATLRRKLNELVETGRLIGNGEKKSRRYARVS